MLRRPMRKLPGRTAVFTAAALWMCAAGAHAQTTHFRDGHGRSAGRAEERGDTTTFRDSHGRTTGRAEQRGGTTYYRDGHGRSTGRAE